MKKTTHSFRMFQLYPFPSLKPFVLVVSLLGMVLGSYAQAQSKDVLTAEVLGVYFTPPTGVAREIIKHIDGAKKTIVAQVYSFTDTKISDALVRAKQRGVVVQLIQDSKAGVHNKETIRQLTQAGIEVRQDKVHMVAHNKVLVIDDEVVITGSYNYTYGADKNNAENAIALKSNKLAEKYTANWKKHWAESVAMPDQKKSN